MPGIRHKNGTHSLPPRSETDCATYASFNWRLPLRFKAYGITKEGNRWAVEPISEDTSPHVRYKSGTILAGSSLFWRQRASFHSLQPKPLPALVLTAHLSLWSLAGRQGQNRLPGYKHRFQGSSPFTGSVTLPKPLMCFLHYELPPERFKVFIVRCVVHGQLLLKFLFCKFSLIHTDSHWFFFL